MATEYSFKGTLLGGLDPGGDILNQKNNTTLLNAQNIVYSKPVGNAFQTPTKKFVATTPPPIYVRFPNYIHSGFDYYAPIYQQTIATFENADWPSETWAFSGTGTASLVTAITEGDECLSLACAAGQTAAGTGTVTSKNLTTPKYYILAVDTNWSNVTHFSSGYIRVGSDSSNYRQWAISLPSSGGDNILKFNWASPTATVGTPNTSAIDYVEISITAAGSGSLTVKFDNLRLAAFESTSNTNLVANSGNLYSGSLLDSDALSSSSLVFNLGDAVFVSDSTEEFTPTSLDISLKASFTNVSLESSTLSSSGFYFSQFPKTGSVVNNILYYVNGTDGYFSYDPNATAGSRHTRISSVNYRYICQHKNMMWLVHTDEPNMVYPTDLNDPSTITAGNAISIPNTPGTYITGVYSMDDYLLVTRSTDKWMIYGSNPDSTTGDMVLRKSKARTGCTEQRIGCRVGQFWYGFDGNGIYQFDGNDDTLISIGMAPLLASAHTKACSLNYNPIRNVLCFYYTKSTGTSNPESTPANRYTYLYYFDSKSWGVSGGISDASSAKYWGVYWGGSVYSTPRYLEGGLNFYHVDPDVPADISMAWYATTQWNDCKTPDEEKIFLSLTVYGCEVASKVLPSVTFYIYTDYDETTIKQTISNVTPTNGYWALGLTGCSGRAISFKIAGTCADQKDNAVMLSGYTGTYSLVEDP